MIFKRHQQFCHGKGRKLIFTSSANIIKKMAVRVQVVSYKKMIIYSHIFLFCVEKVWFIITMRNSVD